MSIVRKVAINNLILLSERLFCALLGFLVSIWLIRYLKPEKYGIYSLIFAWFTFLNVFTPYTIEQIVARESVKNPQKMQKFMGAGFAIKIFLALIGWTVGIFTTWLLGYPHKYIFYLAIVLFGLIGNASYVLQVPHQIELRLLYPALAEGGSNFLYQVARALLIILKFGLASFFWAHLLWRLFQLFLFSLLGLEKKYRPSFKFSFGEVKTIITASWILLINNVFVMIISRIDQLMLYPIWGEQKVGLYGSCARLTDYPILIATVWFITVFPILTKYLGESRSAFEQAGKYSFKYLSIISVFIWIAFAGFSKEILGVLFGKDYLSAQPALFWLSTALVFSFLQVGLFHLALSQNKEKIWLLINGVGAVCNVVLNLALIPNYSIMGAGIATFSAFFIQVVMNAIIKEFRENFVIMLKSSLLPLLAGGLFVFLANYFKLNLFPWLGIFWIIFFAFLLISKSLTLSEIRTIYQALFSRR